jgi:hypothetical protein
MSSTKSLAFDFSKRNSDFPVLHKEIIGAFGHLLIVSSPPPPSLFSSPWSISSIKHTTHLCLDTISLCPLCPLCPLPRPTPFSQAA